MNQMKIFLLGAAALVVCLRANGFETHETSETTTLFIVRHAEKTGESRDAPLSDIGRRRAETLAWMLRDVSFDAVLSTDLARTRDTVTRIGESNHKKVSFYSPGGGSLVKRIQTQHGGQTVLICGHSNTIPSLLDELGISIDEKILSGYDDLFIVSTDFRGRASMQRLHFPGAH